jgi:hypothetical protein
MNEKTMEEISNDIFKAIEKLIKTYLKGDLLVEEYHGKFADMVASYAFFLNEATLNTCGSRA